MKKSIVILVIGVLILGGIFVLPQFSGILTSYDDIDPTEQYETVSGQPHGILSVAPLSQHESGTLYVTSSRDVNTCTIRDPHNGYEEQGTLDLTEEQTSHSLPDQEVVVTCTFNTEDDEISQEYLLAYNRYFEGEDGSQYVLQLY